MSYYYSRKLKMPFDEVLLKIGHTLKQQGFGIITTIDLKDTLKQKLNVDFRNYTILGACNPQFAYQSDLIEATINTLRKAVTEEIIVVSVVLFIFLFHVRSGLIVVITIPVSVLFAFIMMNWFGITSNIMSLSGVALAVGDLVDAGIVMVENAMKAVSGETETA